MQMKVSTRTVKTCINLLAHLKTLTTKNYQNKAALNKTSMTNNFNIAFVETTPKNSERRHTVGVISTAHETPKISLEPKADFSKRRQSVLEIRPFTRMDTMYEGSLTKLASKMNQNPERVHRSAY